MTPDQIALLRSSFDKVRPLFEGDMAEQGRKLMATLSVVISGIDSLPVLLPAVRHLGARHAGYGVLDRHFAPVGAALIWTLAPGLGAAFAAETHEAWVPAYGTLPGVMQDAMKTGTAAARIAAS